MICMQLVVCLALVPAMIVAEIYYLGGCGDFKSMLDDNAGTQQGINTLGQFFDSPNTYMYMWDPSPIESNQSCNSMKTTVTAGVRTFTYAVNNNMTSYMGTMKHVLTPQVRLELNGTLPGTVLGSSKGIAYWYPLYISSTDVIFIACRGAFLGRLETIYVLTNQIYGGINQTCSSSAVQSVINKKVKGLPSAAGGSSNCTAL